MDGSILRCPSEDTADDLEQIERAVPANAAAGDRYAPALMAALDSERKA